MPSVLPCCPWLLVFHSMTSIHGHRHPRNGCKLFIRAILMARCWNVFKAIGVSGCKVSFGTLHLHYQISMTTTLQNMKVRPGSISIVNCPTYLQRKNIFFIFYFYKKRNTSSPFVRPIHIHCTPGLAGLRPASRHLAQVCGGYVRSVNCIYPRKKNFSYLQSQKEYGCQW